MATREICFLCGNAIPANAWICTECESWQLFHRRPTFVARIVLVLLAPFVAWFIADRYQRHESVRAITENHITRVNEQITTLVDMSHEFQAMADSFATNCGKEAQGATNLCLSEYVARIFRINEYVARLSWKAGLLPMSEQIDAAQRRWQDVWWSQVSGKLKMSLVAMAVSGRLLKCQSLDFSGSECGGELNHILYPFRNETTNLMCVFTVWHRSHLVELYRLLPNSEEKENLISGVSWQQERSFCAKQASARVADAERARP